MKFLSTPSARRATRASLCATICKQFLSTPSARRATVPCVVVEMDERISIHALREEGDLLDTPFFYFFTNFYPRPPRGGRPSFGGDLVDQNMISIHALREEGDLRQAFQVQKYYISIHALREEGDIARVVSKP